METGLIRLTPHQGTDAECHAEPDPPGVTGVDSLNPDSAQQPDVRMASTARVQNGKQNSLMDQVLNHSPEEPPRP
ncbi:hypothetical protein C3432_10205 [Citrobacter amalonaticus]|uniref:Uncharacterized protein n=1 Tax=Citrobacter amalonaticus TaxID=35703 RepID=A0A2S4S028_CITAM|nr:hypothetical protein C3432_10205 [Citrobacter amalonaticus]POT76206.1 hypothetical protein C3436_01615 [Citrobacter amalonaticus]POU66795.1 hypothetical protein C3430_08405 [Citrobacter amalonaticus]POV05441.1 hypothetical protein C3424_08920 [Citrobacter amalonaticus]